MDISSWILAFLLRQKSVDDHLLNSIIRVLPLPNDNPSLKRRLLLRQIESDAQKGIISERILGFLEQIEELDHREGNIEVSEAMKMAYCSVAVHCTVKFIEESVDDKEGKYCSAVGRIWRGRIRKMVRFDALERVGLVSDDLISWMDDIEAGVWDAGVCEKLLVSYKGLNVLEALRGYLHEAEEKMGPSFLELVAMALSEEALRDIANGGSKINETCKTIVIRRQKFIDTIRPRKVRHVTHRVFKIANTEETSPNRHDSVSTPEVSKVQEAPATNTLELHQLAKDPLPNALPSKATIGCENMAHDHDKNSEALQGDRDDLDVGLCIDQNKRPKFSPMERNTTARTVEKSDSIDDGSQTRHHLHSPKKREASPLKNLEYKRPSRTRKKKFWTNVEEDTLRTGVQKYGKGNWKLILNMYRDIFEGRTEVDLKDKWRNLTR